MTESAARPKEIWVLDPGMMEAGGHHAALAETLCQAMTSRADLSVKVFAHKLLDKQLLERFESSGISSELSFDSVFYKHFHDGADLGFAGLQQYTRTLALEYKGLLVRAIEQAKLQSMIVFLPCLNWEHASALGFAVKQLEFELNSNRVRIVACAMYTPNSSDQVLSRKSIWYKLAFASLMNYQFLSLYCSEQELCMAYADLLMINKLDVHPCYLIDWASANKTIAQKTDSSKKLYLLYLGDAKEDKGFNRLPEVLQNGLETTDSNVEFLIQFTLAWEYPEIMTTVDALKTLAENESRLTLHHGFWSNDDVIRRLQQIDGAICTYDTEAYQHKSSGLVWMLAFFNKPVILSDNCWLSREAERLNVPLAIDSDLNVKCFDQLNVTAAKNSSYADNLFMPLFNWLLSH